MKNTIYLIYFVFTCLSLFSGCNKDDEQTALPIVEIEDNSTSIIEAQRTFTQFLHMAATSNLITQANVTIPEGMDCMEVVEETTTINGEDVVTSKTITFINDGNQENNDGAIGCNFSTGCRVLGSIKFERTVRTENGQEIPYDKLNILGDFWLNGFNIKLIDETPDEQDDSQKFVAFTSATVANNFNSIFNVFISPNTTVRLTGPAHEELGTNYIINLIPFANTTPNSFTSHGKLIFSLDFNGDGTIDANDLITNLTTFNELFSQTYTLKIETKSGQTPITIPQNFQKTDYWQAIYDRGNTHGEYTFFTDGGATDGLKFSFDCEDFIDGKLVFNKLGSTADIGCFFRYKDYDFGYSEGQSTDCETNQDSNTCDNWVLVKSYVESANANNPNECETLLNSGQCGQSTNTNICRQDCQTMRLVKL